MGRITMSNAEVGPITEQPEARPEVAEIVPGPSANADGKWAAPLNPCANPCATLLICLKLYCCLPCTIMEVAGYAGKNACCSCLCYQCCAPFIRKAIREKHGIQGSLKNDCLVNWCCACCVLIQMASETKKGTVEK